MTTPETSTGHAMVSGFDEESIVSNATSSSSPIVSDEQLQTITFVNRAIIGQILALMGMGSNLLNLLVFFQMGFKESINISLFCLAMSDFMSCLTIAWGNICYTPAFFRLDLPFSAFQIGYVTAGVPHTIFIKITGCITAYIAFERCICITFPLMVKTIITPTTVKIVIICTYISVIGVYAPTYYINQLVWKFHPSLNKTLLELVSSKDRLEIEQWLFPIRGVFLTWSLFILITVCTVAMVVNLKRKSEWRKKVAATSNQEESRDDKVATLVVFVTTVFIVCFIPYSMTAAAMSLEPELAVGRRYQNLLQVFASIIYLFESINANINVFIYYFGSSKYKAMFDKIFFTKK